VPSRLIAALPWRRASRETAAIDDAVERTRGGTFRALQNRNYRLFYIGQSISLSGTWMQTIAQALLVLQITDSKVALGTVTMLQFLPITVLVLFAGVLADRVPKRELIIATRVLAMAQAAAITALVWSGQVELWHVYVLALLLGVANAFEQPTRQAFVVEMVGRDDLMNAVALNSGMFNGARLIGPAVGGVLIAAFGLKWAFLINAVSFIPTIFALTMMDASQFHATKGRVAEGGNPLRELTAGISYAIRTPSAMMVLIIMAAVGTFGINFTVMLPLIARYVLDRGSAGFGFMTSAVGLGALLAAFTLANRTDVTRRTLFVGGAAFGVLLALIAVSHWYAATLLLLVLLGVAHTTFASTANVSLQLTAPDHLRGRVMSLYMLLIAGSTPIGGYLTGLMAEHFGVSTAIGINASICLLGTAAGLLYYFTHREAIGATAGQPALAT
jgi:MFS family permease